MSKHIYCRSRNSMFHETIQAASKLALLSTPQLVLKKINPEYSSGIQKDWCWRWSFNIWPPDAKGRLIRKAPDTGKEWRQKEKKVTEDEMVGWHHWFNGHELQKMVMDRRLCVLQSTGSERARHDFAAEWQLTCHLLHAANCVARALL